LNWRYLSRRIAGRLGSRKQERADCELIKRSGLFDRAWYLAQCRKHTRPPSNPILDYVRRGTREGLTPNPLFDGEWYLDRYPDVRAVGANPLVHYLICGAIEGREPGPFFDTEYYLSEHPELNSPQGAPDGEINAPPLAPLDSARINENASPVEFIDRSIISPPRHINPLVHYLENGCHEGVLPFDPTHLLGGMKIAVIVHLFYADLWIEIASRLRSIPIDFDLFVSVPLENAGELRTLVLRDYSQARVLEVPNAGRDVGAFFTVLPAVLAGDYTVLCKLHTKRGSEYPKVWRDLLLRGLLANKMLVTKILHAFACDSELKLAGAREVYLSGTTQMAQNQARVEEIVRLLYPGQPIPTNWGFFAGTMFWARPGLFRSLSQCGDRALSFEDDNTRNDGQLAHAFERLFGLLATAEGAHIGLTDIAGRHPLGGAIHVTKAPGQPWEGSFLRFLKDRAVSLKAGQGVVGDAESRAGPKGVATRVEQVRLGIQFRAVHHVARAKARFPRSSRHVLRGLKLAWWMASLQVAPRLRDVYFKRMQARLVASSPLFDREWYLERYPEVRVARADPALHYVMAGAAGDRDPSPRFNAAWYLSYYPDVAVSGVNPLVHYLRHGVKEGRHARASEIVIGKVTDAALSCRKRPNSGGEVSIFVTHSPDGRLKPHVRHYLEALRRHGISPILIVAADREFDELGDALLSVLDGLYIRQNVGYDFAAWAHILQENPNLLRADILYLINDSTIGPLNEKKFEALLRKVRSSTAAVIGLTDSYEREWHIQSYFIALKSAALSAPALASFMGDIMNLSAKRDVVYAYELRFASLMQAAGLSCKVLFPARKSPYNPSLADWLTLVRSGLPFVKLAALRNASSSFGGTDWRKVLQDEGFDYRLVEQAAALSP
jgi:lipopolysaccharide biosynthesis protein